MKNILSYLFPVAILMIASCKEEPPAINYLPDNKSFDTTYITSTIPLAQAKEILLEDVSGVKCVNCPDAAAIAKTLVDQNPGRINVVTVQPKVQGLDSFTEPIDKDGVKTTNDMRTDAGGAICQLVGIPNALPSGYVNRKIYSGKTDPILSRDEWPGAVADELAGTTPVNIDLVATYDPVTTEMSVEVTLTYTKTVTNNNYISVAILEDSIVDAQERKQGLDIIFDPNYLHRHMMRGMFTNYTGDLLNTSPAIALTPGRVIKRGYKTKIKAYSNPKNFYVIAYVHEDATSKYVLHSHEIEVN